MFLDIARVVEVIAAFAVYGVSEADTLMAVVCDVVMAVEVEMVMGHCVGVLIVGYR